MLPQIEKLLVVQDRDLKIAAIQKELDHLPLEEEDAQEKLEEDRTRVESAKKTVQENEIAMKNLEIEIETRNDSITKLKIQQYETKKNEEFRAMGHEIERYGNEVRKLEDEELELMEKGEILKATLKEASATFANTKEIVDEEMGDITSRRANLLKEMEELKVSREAATGEVDPDTLDIYNRLFVSKGGLVVVGLVDEKCQGCHMKVTKSTAINVRNEHEVTHCENCGRILYWWTA